MQIALAQINPIVGSLKHNQQQILSYIRKAKEQGAELVIFPEMALCGYPPEDLLLLPSFITALQSHLLPIIEATRGVAAIVGTVRENPSKGEKRLFNTAAIMENGELIGFADKALLPDYDVFSERRYFEPGTSTKVWSLRKKHVAVTICEDLWQHAEAVEYASYSRDPVEEIKDKNPELVVNLSSSPYYMSRTQTRLAVCQKVVATLKCPLVLCNQVGGNDSLIFDGYSLALNDKGDLTGVAQGFKEDLFIVDPERGNPSKKLYLNPQQELYKALVLGVEDYFQKLGFKKACLGLSGGIDSAVVAVIAAEALGKQNLLALALPSRYSSESSLQDADALAKNLDLEIQKLSIEPPFESFLQMLAPSFGDHPFDSTEENLQARIRGTLLMAFSNKFGYLVLSTGNKSEMAMGYSTLYGDMCGGLAVLNDVTKEQVYRLAHFINRDTAIIPPSIISKPPSAELRPNQKDTDSLPEYALVDQVLQSYIEEHLSPKEIADRHHLDLALVTSLVQKIHQNEYKRRQSPPGLRVTKRAFTFGRRFPIVQHWNVHQ